MVLDLENGRPDARMAQEVNQQSSAEVAHANLLGEASVLDLLHHGPRRRDGVVRERHRSSLGAVPPFGRVASIDGDVFE